MTGLDQELVSVASCTCGARSVTLKRFGDVPPGFYLIVHDEPELHAEFVRDDERTACELFAEISTSVLSHVGEPS